MGNYYGEEDLDMNPATLGASSDVTIMDAKYTSTEMDIWYTLDTTQDEVNDKENSKMSKDAMKEIQDMFTEDKGWNTEEDMLKDMAEFRRKRRNV